MLTELAPAKLNLALHVRGRRDDGYHELDTLFAFVDRGDVVGFEAADDLSLSIHGPHGDGLDAGPDNLVMRAALLLRQHANCSRGASLSLEKNLPVASGIGGGSADAAAMLRLLDRAWSLGLGPDGLMPLARALGSDVPACLYGRTALATGRGDELKPVDNDLSGAYILMANPGVSVSTPDIFGRWNGADGGPLPPLPVSNILRDGHNGLTEPAIAVAPVISTVMDALKASGAGTVRMSGSGATCFAVYESETIRDQAAKAISANHPAWWTMACRLT